MKRQLTHAWPSTSFQLGSHPYPLTFWTTKSAVKTVKECRRAYTRPCVGGGGADIHPKVKQTHNTLCVQHMQRGITTFTRYAWMTRHTDILGLGSVSSDWYQPIGRQGLS